MSQSLTIDDREYIPAGEVGQHFGYTRDYIITLTRDGRIDGQKIGHRWYVNLDSARHFFETAEAEREVRRKYVSEVRKAELRARQSQASTFSPAVHASTAFVEAFAIIVLGILVGTTGYLGTNVLQQQAGVVNTNSSFLEGLAISFYELVSSKRVSVTKAAPQSFLEERGVEENAAVLPPATTTYTSLVIGKDQVLTTTTVESIRDSFSDDVSVSIDPHNPDSGIIVPHFKSRDGEAYRFLMVPVTEEGDS